MHGMREKEAMRQVEQDSRDEHQSDEHFEVEVVINEQGLVFVPELGHV